MKKILKIACLGILGLMVLGTIVLAGGAWYLYNRFTPPETKKLGRAYRLMGEKKHDAALALCDEILKENPRSTSALTCKAEIETAKNEPEKAIETLDRALSNDPDSCPALQKKGELLFAMKRYPEALRVYDEGLAKAEGMT